MCLVTFHKEPLIASKDIKVYKHVHTIFTDKAESPYQNSMFSLNKKASAYPSKTHLTPYKDNKWKIAEGVIHACLWPNFEIGKCLEACIPKGTEYWYGIDKSTICAKNLFITNKEVKPKDCAGLDIEIAHAVYAKSPKNNIGLAVGDFIDGPNNTQGIIVGFKHNEPIVADIQNLIKAAIDTYPCNILHEPILNLEEARKDMDGYRHFWAWEEFTLKDNQDRYPAYHAVAKLSLNHYIPAFGEMELVWKNLIYIAAGCSIIGIACPFVMNKWFWTSTERSYSYAYVNILGYNRSYIYAVCKYYSYSLVPFIAMSIS